MSTTNSIVQVREDQQEKGLTRIQNYLEAPIVQKRFAQIFGEKGAASYISSVLIAVADSKKLQECTPQSIYIAALRAATLKLSVDPSTGQAYLVPYRGYAKLIPGYKGLYDMAIRTGRYRYINVSKIFEGQEVIEDQITGFHRIQGRKASDKHIGWIAAFEMLPKWGCYSKTLYMTVEEIHNHAKAYNPDAYDQANGVWRKETEKMERKTVLRLLLKKWGYLDPTDVAVLNELDNEDPIDALPPTDVIDREPIRAPEPKHSPAANVAILNGEGNPDPVKDETWALFEQWSERGRKVGVIPPEINRAGMTDPDMRTYLEDDFIPLVERAEHDAELKARQEQQ